jgi:hypothetical protein
MPALAPGRALVVLFLARPAGSLGGGDDLHERRRHRSDRERSTDMSTRFGEAVFRRPTGRLVQGTGAPELPVSRALGLGRGLSLAVVLDAARLCAQMSCAASRERYRHVVEWSPSRRAVTRMVDAVGDEARRVLEQAPAPDDDGEVLVIHVDGRGAPRISEIERERRCRRRVPRSDDATRRAGRRLRREALFAWGQREAVKRGHGSEHVLFLADGSEHVGRLKDEHFPAAESCPCWGHAVEQLLTPTRRRRTPTMMGSATPATP